MDKTRKKNFGNRNNQKNNYQNKDFGNLKNHNRGKEFHFDNSNYENAEAEKENRQAILEVKSRQIICSKCQTPITDISSAIDDKITGKPVHFDCVLNQLKETENAGENEKIAYIGQGRFAVLHYENIRDQKNFTIKKIIEWENREKKSEWRDELSGLYSRIK